MRQSRRNSGFPIVPRNRRPDVVAVIVCCFALVACIWITQPDLHLAVRIIGTVLLAAIAAGYGFSDHLRVWWQKQGYSIQIEGRELLSIAKVQIILACCKRIQQDIPAVQCAVHDRHRNEDVIVQADMELALLPIELTYNSSYSGENPPMAWGVAKFVDNQWQATSIVLYGVKAEVVRQLNKDCTR